MTDLPIPKYAIGDIVYKPGITGTNEKLPCPDCLGEKAWKLLTPTGIEHTLACPRCSDAYSSLGDNIPSLTIRREQSTVARLTIGSIEIKSDPRHGDSAVKYMAHETGVGSGSVYNERDLYSDGAAAQAMAQVMADLANAKLDESRSVIAARRFSGLQIFEALKKKAWDQSYESWAAYRLLRGHLEDRLPEIPDADNEDQAAVREAIEQFDRYVIDPKMEAWKLHPLDEIIAACQRGDIAAVDEIVKRLREENAL